MSQVMSINKQTGVVRFRAPLDHVSTKHAIIFVDRVMRQFAVTARVEADGVMVTVTVPDEGGGPDQCPPLHHNWRHCGQ